jgi:FdrA protein
MTIRHKTYSNLYRDSVALMRLSSDLTNLPGIVQASVVMATAANLALLAEAGLTDGPIDVSPDKLLIVIDGKDEATIDAAMTVAETALTSAPAAIMDGEGRPAIRPKSIAMAAGAAGAAGTAETATLALISTPGDYAASEALKALRLGLNVMIFSDNVSLDDEIMLKQVGKASNLLVMGPDCGTAIINGVPLGFANEVRQGHIGIVAASGTGLQQVCCLIDRYGKGVSQAIGTGGRDLRTEVGGITMSQGLAALAEDPETSVIVLLSKPPAPDVAARIIAEAIAARKPVVINFLGAAAGQISGDNIFAAPTLAHAARTAVAIANGDSPGEAGQPEGDMSRAAAASDRLAPDQRYIRGLFSGGTFCYEAVMLLHDAVGDVWSNTPREAGYLLTDIWSSQGHTIIDLGADDFTRGRPHPMIDHRLRNDRLIIEADDPETAVILFDVVLGHGAHPDPAEAMLPAIEAARKSVSAAGRDIVFIGSVCGTEQDPQSLSRQEKRLQDAGVLLAESNAAAARLAISVLEQIK